MIILNALLRLSNAFFIHSKWKDTISKENDPSFQILSIFVYHL